MNQERREPPGTVETQIIRLRRGVGQTSPGRALKRLLGRELRIPARTPPQPEALDALPGEAELPEEIRDMQILVAAREWRREALSRARVAGPRHGHEHVAAAIPSARTNIVLVSHCDFTGNSALHVYAIACELHRRGHSPIVAVPDNAESVEDVGRPPFPVLTHADAVSAALEFPDGRGPDLVHAFSPRELVRKTVLELVRAYGCSYLVHLEDNDEVVLSGELGGADIDTLRHLPLPLLDRIIRPRQSHPLRAARFFERAGGMTVLIDRLLELVPEGVPAVVMPAGFDEAVLDPRRSRDEVRAELGLGPQDLAIVYTGNVHSLNRSEVRDLYVAVGELRRAGHRAVLVKTGWGSGVAATFPSLGAGIRNLGWVPRSSIPDLLAAADVLVQPGGPGPFNDFRFPSKLPEYLASGRPVVLPRTNIGLELRDGEEALVLDRGDAAEIAEVVARVASDPALGARLGEGGRAFALRELRWSASVDRLEELLAATAADPRPPAPAWALEGTNPPAMLVALVPELPGAAEAIAARAAGVFGFCLAAGALPESFEVISPGFPFCLRVSDADRVSVATALGSPGYIRLEGAALVPYLVRTPGAGLPPSIEFDSEMPIRLAAVEDLPSSGPGYEEVMHRRLAAPLPESPFFRSLAPPDDPTDLPLYTTWLRKLVIQTAIRAPAQPPLLFVDATQAWVLPWCDAWLAATGEGLRAGVKQFYASQSLRMSDSEADLIIRST
jgi:glycosyltransferase involved in cell wall biosynthesis